MSNEEPGELGRKVREIWNRNATFWDERIGEGNDFQRLLINPTTERLLELKAGELILDAACGNGSFSRRLAQLGARVVAFDFSETFLERARARTTERAGQIDYLLVDAADQGQLLSLGERHFDAAVCNMALMDMAEIDVFLESLSRLLKPGGRFVFSVIHPCFNSVGMKKVIEIEDREGELVTEHAVKIGQYISPVVFKGLGIVGQPMPHYYFHRPLSLLLDRCFRAGFYLDGFEEPVFDQRGEPDRPSSWENFREIPPAIVARLRLPKD